jgi:hypothetical protein
MCQELGRYTTDVGGLFYAPFVDECDEWTLLDGVFYSQREKKETIS